MALASSRLTPLQTELLEAFFGHEDRFYLTGGGALAGFHLGHRETHDLDLFALDPIMDDGVRALRQAARDVGASWREVRTALEFRRVPPPTRRRLRHRRSRDRARRAGASREAGARFRSCGPSREILANKLCALIGRAEIRDLVDVRALEGLGLSLTDALTAGERKDGGLTPAQLAWVLSQITIADDADLPGGVGPAELREYLNGLVDRLARLARP